jgi:hypothetical protein
MFSPDEKAAEKAGKDAHTSGMSRDRNPHQPKTMLWMCWNLGWDLSRKREIQALEGIYHGYSGL